MASAGPYASLHLIPDNHANIPPLSFLQAGCPSCRPTNSVKALKAVVVVVVVQNVIVGFCLHKQDECEEGEIKEMDDESPCSDGRPYIERPSSPPSVCRFYLRGTCTWGGNCRFHHPGISDHAVKWQLIAFFLQLEYVGELYEWINIK